MPRSFVSKGERGERRLDLVEFPKISKAIGIDPIKIIEELEQVSQNEKNHEGESIRRQEQRFCRS